MPASVRVPFAVVAALSCSVPMAAQAPAGLAQPGLTAACGVDVAEDGSCWLLGRDYKAHLTGDHCEFVPALPAAPDNRRFGLTLRAVVLGELALYDATAAAAAPAARRVTGTRVERDLGLVVERYEATARGVEQSFVVATAPRQPGDLVVRAVLSGGLTAAPRADGGIDFHDGRHGGVTVGAVTGIDAAGARCAGTIAGVDGGLELRLPASFVATAQFPLTLDPLLGAFVLPGGSTLDDSQIELAYARLADVHLATWTRTFSLTDQDVRAQRIDANGALVGGLLAITNTSVIEQRAVVAAVRSNDRFVVAWQTSTSPFGPWSVAARTIDSATGAVAATTTVAASGGNVAVCGDRSVLGASVRFAWYDVAAGIVSSTAVVSAAGALSFGAAVVVDPAVTRTSGPWISRSSAAGQVAVVTWCEMQLSGQVRARAISHTGTPLAATVTASTPGTTVWPAVVDGDGTDFLVLCQQSLGLFAVRLAWNGSALIGLAAAPLPNTSNAAAPAVAWLGDRYLAAWQMPTANPFQTTVRYRALDHTCQDCGLEHTVTTALAPSARAPAIAATFATTGASGDALFGWEENALTPPFAGHVLAQRFARQLGVPPQLLSSGCNGVGTAATNGPFALGNADFRFELSGADPTAPIALLGLSDHSLPAVPCGCALMQALVLYATLPTGGSASIAFPVPCNPTLLGFALEYQWLLLGASSSPCPLVPGLVGGDRWLLTLAE